MQHKWELKVGVELHGGSSLPTRIRCKQWVNQASKARPATATNTAVQALVDAMDLESIDEATSALQDLLQQGDDRVAQDLARIARGSGDLDTRRLALSALAGARVASRMGSVTSLIRDLCAGSEESLQVSAIAAIAHLSNKHRDELRSVVSSLAASSTPRVRAAALALLRG